MRRDTTQLDWIELGDRCCAWLLIENDEAHYSLRSIANRLESARRITVNSSVLGVDT